MKKLIPALFVLVCLIQLSVPAWMIGRREAALRHGDVYRFKTRPVDPYDAFRGRYVALDFEQASRSFILDGKLSRGDVVYATVIEGNDGFAELLGLNRTPPDDAISIPVRVLWQDRERQVRFRLPFDRYYMEETLAPEAERKYRQANRSRTNETYAAVRINKGFPVIEDLIIDGRPVGDYFNGTPETTAP